MRFPFDQQKQFVIPGPHTRDVTPVGIHKYYYRHFTNNRALSRITRIIYSVIPDSDRESRYVFNIGPQIINNNKTFALARFYVSTELCVSSRENLRRAA